MDSAISLHEALGTLSELNCGSAEWCIELELRPAEGAGPRVMKRNFLEFLRFLSRFGHSPGAHCCPAHVRICKGGELLHNIDRAVYKYGVEVHRCGVLAHQH